MMAILFMFYICKKVADSKKFIGYSLLIQDVLRYRHS